MVRGPAPQDAVGTAINHAIESVFGNVRVLFLVMIALAGVSTVGGTAATFAHAVHANRRESDRAGVEIQIIVGLQQVDGPFHQVLPERVRAEM